MRIGHARVSTDDQTLNLQRDALTMAKCRQVYEEHAGGKNTTRAELDACLKSVREGDTLIVWRLAEKSDTQSPTGRLVFHVFAPWPRSSET
jgi:DNA invertase Pin-like site-specific DNA recombinase